MSIWENMKFLCKLEQSVYNFWWIRYPFLALEIFNCEINPLLEKFFEAPEPKQAASESTQETKSNTIDDGDSDVLTDDLGAPASQEDDDNDKEDGKEN